MGISIILLVLIVFSLSASVFSPKLAIAESTQQNYIDVNYANIEGVNVPITTYDYFAQLYEVKYTLTNSSDNLILNFSYNANPVQYLIKPSANCIPLTEPFFIFYRIMGYKCNFGQVKAGNILDIIFHNAKLFGFI